MSVEQTQYEAPRVEEIDTDDGPIMAVPGNSVPVGAG